MKPVLAACCPGEQFSSRWVKSWTELVNRLLDEFDVVPLFNFCTCPFTIRNVMAEMALSLPRLDYVLWIDDDNPLVSEQFDKLWRGLCSQRDAAAVAGWAWCENDQYESGAMISCGLLNPNGTVAPFPPGEIIGQRDLIEVDYTGFPAILMHADTLRKAGPSPFAPFIDPVFEYGYSGEDYAFCRHVRERAGLKLFVDPMCQVPHLKLRAINPSLLLKTKQCAA